jgi:hypothetical protein
MARPQNSPRGNFGKHRVEIGAADGLYFNDYSSSTALIDANSTGLKLAGALYLSGKSTSMLSQNTTGLKVAGGLYISGQTAEPATQNSTGFLFPDQIRVGGQRYIGGNTTAYLFTTETGLPTSDGGNYKWTFVVNSTGVAGFAINTTGTTWKYCQMTSLINTT